MIPFLLTASIAATSPPQGATDRIATSLNAGWRVLRGEAVGADLEATKDSDWAAVTLPYTANGGDGEDGGGYYRGPVWYRRWLDLTHKPAGKRAYLEFDGAAVSSDVYVNGHLLAHHDGGFARFRVDISDAVRVGANLIAVRTSNGKDLKIAPLGGDFTLFGGLYRPVRLVETPDVHIDMLDYGGPGLYGHVTELTDRRARLDARTRVRNDTSAQAAVTVEVRILDKAGQIVGSGTRLLTIAPLSTLETAIPLTVAAPHRWNGVHDPYLYRLAASVRGQTGNIDRVEVPLGFRTVAFDPDRGFLLNGRPYALHGVNYFHPERPGSGTAVTDGEIDDDMASLSELGVTGLRLVHFQHPQRVYDDADRMGLPVWTEIPLNGVVDPGNGFKANVADQMRELIRQNYNHPSVILWGLGNEVYSTEPVVAQILRSVAAVAKAEDPSRPTAYAHCCQADDDPKALISDVIGFNRYMGWYADEGAGIGVWADDYHKSAPRRPFAVSEYGAGASVRHQQVPPPAHNVPPGGWHPEQAQTAYHVSNWQKLRTRPYLSGSFVWVAFDLASDGRREGDRPGINDKGLVTYDRKTRKDAFYWYQANWSDRPVLHLLNSRLDVRTEATTAVEAVSNAPAVTLSVNGLRVGTLPVVDRHVLFRNVALRPGSNVIRLQAVRSGVRLSDQASWFRAAPSSFGAEAIPPAQRELPGSVKADAPPGQ